MIKKCCLLLIKGFYITVSQLGNRTLTFPVG